jgi:hypothetical protein
MDLTEGNEGNKENCRLTFPAPTILGEGHFAFTRFP